MTLLRSPRFECQGNNLLASRLFTAVQAVAWFRLFWRHLATMFCCRGRCSVVIYVAPCDENVGIRFFLIGLWLLFFQVGQVIRLESELFGPMVMR